MQLLPHSLTSIRVFDAAARHLSCSRAAEELFLTQSAVSKQLQSLEEHLGVDLFHRVHHGLELTEAGIVYWNAVRPALTILAQATTAVRHLREDDGIVHLGMPPTLGQKWLIPRLRQFNNANPDIVVHFTPRHAQETSSTALNAEIRFGRGSWPGMRAHYLFGRELYPICSPELLEQQPIHVDADVLRHRLMEHIQLPYVWDRWLAERSVTGYDARQTQKYEQFSLMIPAVVAGLGIGFMPRFLVEEELRSQKLVLMSDAYLESDYSYYLVSSKDRKTGRALERFSEWLLAEAALARG